jgi:hypothetical protein
MDHEHKVVQRTCFNENLPSLIGSLIVKGRQVFCASTIKNNRFLPPCWFLFCFHCDYCLNGVL